MGQSKENWDSQGGEVGHFSKMQISNNMAMMTWKTPVYVTAAILFVSRAALASLKILWFARGSALPKGHFFTKAPYFEMGHVSPQCLSLGAFVPQGGPLGLVSSFCL